MCKPQEKIRGRCLGGGGTKAATLGYEASPEI